MTLPLLKHITPSSKNLLAIAHTQVGEATKIFGVVVQQRGDDIAPTTYVEEDAIADFPKSLKSSPTHLVVTDTQVLTKTVTGTGTETEILGRAFPNFKDDNFYYQILSTDTLSWVTICRKQHVENLCTQYEQQGFAIVSITLGHLPLAGVAPYLKETVVYTPTAKVTIAQGALATVENVIPQETATYRLEGLEVPHTHLLAFALGVVAFTKNVTFVGNTTQKNQALAIAVKEKRFFKQTLTYGIAGLLGILLINFFVFSTAFSKWQQLQEEVQLYTQQKEQIVQRQTQLKTKEALVRSIINSGFSKSSYYIDQIIQRLPSTVLLQSLTYQPLRKSIRAKQPIQYTANTLHLTGKTIDKIAFTQWLQDLESLNDFQKVTILQYGVDTKNNTTFEVILTIATHDTAQ